MAKNQARIRRGDTVKLGGLTCRVILSDADGRLWIRDQAGDNYVVWWHRVKKQSITRAKSAGGKAHG